MYTYVYIYIYIYMYAIMKKQCVSPGYHHNGFLATFALGHMTYGYTLLILMTNLYIYIYIYI